MQQLHCIISGRVQAGHYTQFVKNIAEDMSLVGFVAGLPDGSVEVLVQGEYGVLKVFEQHLARGPDGSMVTGVYDEWAKDPVKRYEDFKML